MVAAGIALLHFSIRFRLEAVTGNRIEAIDLEYHARNFEALAVILLFFCWMPCSNAAWITNAKYKTLQTKVAAMESPSDDSTELTGVAHGISQTGDRIAASVDRHHNGRITETYTVKLSSGSTVTFKGTENNEQPRSVYRTAERTCADGGCGPSGSVGGARSENAIAYELRDGALHESADRAGAISDADEHGERRFRAASQAF